MFPNIKPIETNYKNYRFRSRLEARWAVFFDALGVEWEYEPEGYTLPSGCYLPDFRFKALGPRGPWVEVKAAEPSQHEMQLLGELCEGLGMHGFIVGGLPGADCHVTLASKGGECLLGSELRELAGFLGCDDHTRVLDACRAARSARFEFGEQGVAR